MAGLTCDTKSQRAKKARIAEVFDTKALRLLLWFFVIVCTVGWAYTWFFTQSSSAGLMLVPVGPLVMLLFWYHGELKNLKPAEDIADTQELSAVLDRHLLAKLKGDISPTELATITSQLEGGHFYAARYGIGQEFLNNLSSKDPLTTNLVWQSALQMARAHNYPQVSSATVVAALVLAIPAHDTALAQLQLDNEDVASGVSWYNHIRRIIEHYQQRQHFGGIGRDLSFGWAPLLNNVGYNMTDMIERGGMLQRDIVGHHDAISQIMHLLAQPAKRNVVLVGPPGVGKTTIVEAYAQKLIQNGQDVSPEVRYNQVISLDAANLIANAKGRGQLEELLIRVVNEAIAAKNVILFLDDAQLFLKDGTGAVDLSNILLPIIEGGALRLILSLDDQEWLRLSQTNAGLTRQMNRVAVKPLETSDVFRVMEDQVLNLEAQHHVVYMRQALKEAHRLADRYIHEQAFPGKAIKLLEAAAGFPQQQHFVTAQSVQQAVEKTFDVRVQTANTFEEKDILLNLEDRIHQRMINQSRAVRLVSDALRRARAGVRNENKPIGTFLFLGPTGVGKTELSKSLGAVYFGGENRLVRIDLNEFSRPGDTSRILAAGAQDPYSLCAQISKQPFSVVLLDEIEKAHPNVQNLLLQMLDEGILRDSNNKPVSFKDAIIIATSNAGADRIRQHIQNGERLEDFEQQFINELINSNIFKPEFINRFDETVLFRPLTQEELLQVVDLLMNGINQTLASKKVSVQLTSGAKQLLAQAGYDPRLGARPLRRVVQRAVENIVAQRMLQGTAQPGQAITLDAPELQQALDERQ